MREHNLLRSKTLQEENLSSINFECCVIFIQEHCACFWNFCTEGMCRRPFIMIGTLTKLFSSLLNFRINFFNTCYLDPHIKENIVERDPERLASVSVTAEDVQESWILDGKLRSLSQSKIRFSVWLVFFVVVLLWVFFPFWWFYFLIKWTIACINSWWIIIYVWRSHLVLVKQEHKKYGWASKLNLAVGSF